MRNNPQILDEGGNVATDPPPGTNFRKMKLYLSKNYTYEGMELSDENAEDMILSNGVYFVYAKRRRFSTASVGDKIAKNEMLSRKGETNG